MGNTNCLFESCPGWFYVGYRHSNTPFYKNLDWVHTKSDGVCTQAQISRDQLPRDQLTRSTLHEVNFQ